MRRVKSRLLLKFNGKTYELLKTNACFLATPHRSPSQSFFFHSLTFDSSIPTRVKYTMDELLSGEVAYGSRRPPVRPPPPGDASERSKPADSYIIPCSSTAIRIMPLVVVGSLGRDDAPQMLSRQGRKDSCVFSSVQLLVLPHPLTPLVLL